MSQPFSMAFTQGNTTCRKHTDINTGYRQIYQNSSMRDTLNVFNNTVPCLNLILYGTGTCYHYRLFVNITVFHASSLARTKARSQMSTRTELGPSSGTLALPLTKQMCSKFTATAGSCSVYLPSQGTKLTIRSLTLN
jgi:hypothetical protein